MDTLEFLLFLLSIFPIIHSENVCPSSYCGEVLINYPFILQGQEQGNNCTYINLICNNQGIPILSLPFSGEFFVRYIDYYNQRITLNDPGNCLPRRLMKQSMNLSSSPFMAKLYDNYTYYTCPEDSWPVRFNVFQIGCLSNSTNSTIATTEEAEEAQKRIESFGCKNIGSLLFPVTYRGQFQSYGIYTDLSLTWNASDCKDCDPQPAPQDTGSRWHFILSPFFIPSFLLLVLVFLSICVRLINLIAGRNETNATADHNSTTFAALSQSAILTITGLDDSKIKSYTELVVVGENQSISGQENSSCAICLEEYNPEEKVRRIAKCGHFFHNDCIVLWLKKNSTCPVCRTLLSHVIGV